MVVVLPPGARREVSGAGVAYGYGGVDTWMEVGVGVANGAGGGLRFLAASLAATAAKIVFTSASSAHFTVNISCTSSGKLIDLYLDGGSLGLGLKS